MLKKKKCDKVQPNLLDYSKRTLNSQEFEDVSRHLKSCTECLKVLDKEVKFDKQLKAISDEMPSAKVWHNIELQLTPNKSSIFDRIDVRVKSSRLIIAMSALILFVFMIFGSIQYFNKPLIRNDSIQTQTVVVKWTDDPIGGQTDQMADLMTDL